MNRALSFADAKPSGAESRRGAGMRQGLVGGRRASPHGAARCASQALSHLILPFCSTAFVSKQEGSEVVRRLRRYLDSWLG